MMTGQSFLADAFVLLIFAAFWWATGLLIGLSLARWLTFRAEQIRHERQRAAWRAGGLGVRTVAAEKGGRAWQG